MSELLAGRELDALVAEKVMGCKPKRGADGIYNCFCNLEGDEQHGGCGWMSIIKDYSTDIAAAWEVVEKLRTTFRAREIWVRTEPRGHACGISITEGVEYDWYDLAVRESAETAPLAICRAALKAVGA